MNESAQSKVSYKGNDRLLFGLILGVVAFWLFAQTTLNVASDMRRDLGMDASSMNVAVAITSLFCGIFVVVVGGLADRIGRLKITRIGFYLSIAGSLLVAITPRGRRRGGPTAGSRAPRRSAAFSPASLALVKILGTAPNHTCTQLVALGAGRAGLWSLAAARCRRLGWRSIFWGAVA